MDLEHANEDYSQEDKFTEEYGRTTIEAEGSITVATGAEDIVFISTQRCGAHLRACSV